MRITLRQIRSCMTAVTLGAWVLTGAPAFAQIPEDPGAQSLAEPVNTADQHEEAIVSSALQELSRPLSTVSLSASSRFESVDGTQLRQPDNAAARIFEAHGTRTNHQGNWLILKPNRNVYPICHNPLYFEDPNLERCGIGHGYLTELASVAHFMGRVPALPYLIGAQAPNSCVRALPDCPSCHQFGTDAYFPDPNLRAGGIQAAATVGLIFLVP